jgi:hypothetical protein
MIDDWKVITEFTFQRRARDLDYTFIFVRRDDQHKYPVPQAGPELIPRSLFLCYGIYTHTVVSVESEADSEPMAHAMTRLAEHFVTRTSPLFVELGIRS